MYQGDNILSRSTTIQFLADNIIQYLHGLKCKNNFLELLKQNKFEENRMTHILISVIEANNTYVFSKAELSNGFHIDMYSLLLATLQFAISSGNRLTKQEFSQFCACIIFAIINVFCPAIPLNSTDCILVLNELLSYKAKYTKGIDVNMFIQKLENSMPVSQINEILITLNKLGIITYNKQSILLNRQIFFPSVCF